MFLRTSLVTALLLAAGKLIEVKSAYDVPRHLDDDCLGGPFLFCNDDQPKYSCEGSVDGLKYEFSMKCEGGWTGMGVVIPTFVLGELLGILPPAAFFVGDEATGDFGAISLTFASDGGDLDDPATDACAWIVIVGANKFEAKCEDTNGKVEVEIKFDL